MYHRWRIEDGVKERARRHSWRAQGKARVVHKKFGSIVVPCSSKLTALMNAAEVWHCGWTELREAEVWAADMEDVPVSMPFII